jgi:hypothetical protein
MDTTPALTAVAAEKRTSSALAEAIPAGSEPDAGQPCKRADAEKADAERAELAKLVHAKCNAYAGAMVLRMLQGELCRGQTCLRAERIKVSVKKQVFQAKHCKSMFHLFGDDTLCALEVQYDTERFDVVVRWSYWDYTKFALKYTDETAAPAERDAQPSTWVQDYCDDVILGATALPNRQGMFCAALALGRPLALALLHVPRVHQICMRAAVAVLWTGYSDAVYGIDGASEFIGDQWQDTRQYFVIVRCPAHRRCSGRDCNTEDFATCQRCVRWTASFNVATFGVMDFVKASSDPQFWDDLDRIYNVMPTGAGLVGRFGELCGINSERISPVEDCAAGPMAAARAAYAGELIGDLIRYMPGCRAVPNRGAP